MRRAYAMAVDQETIVKDVYKEHALGTCHLVSDTAIRSAEMVVSECPDFDPVQTKEKARQLLMMAGGSSASVTILTDSRPDLARIASTLEFGFEQTLGLGEDMVKTYATGDRKARVKQIKDGAFDIAIRPWLNDFPNDPLGYLTCFRTGNVNNISHYSNSTADAFLDLAIQEADPVARSGWLTLGHNALEADHPAVGLITPIQLTAVAPGVRGIGNNPLGDFELVDLRY